MDDTRTTPADDTTPPAGEFLADSPAGESAAEAAADPAGGTAKEWLSQLQSMIEGLASQAAPVAREVGAKAAELAALAGEKAGPFAHRAAEATEHAGSRLAERGRDLAAELRRDKDNGEDGTALAADAAGATPAEDEPPAG